jgi:hypothetical protein
MSFIIICSVAVLSAYWLLPFFLYQCGHDQTSYLFEAQRFLGGDQLYGPHIAETNPPLIIWFSTIPVLVAQWLHASPVLMLRLLVLIMILGSIAWCIRILHRGTVIVHPTSLVLMAIGLLWIEFSIGPYDFGQREHLLIILLLPYMFAASTGATDRLSLAERCALGITAGFAIWFKPQDIVVLVALEFIVVIRNRSLRRLLAPEFVSVVLICSLILIAVRLFAPLYFTTIYPLLLDTYWALGTHTTFALALTLGNYAKTLAFVLLLWFLMRGALRNPFEILLFLLCSIAATVAFDVQHTLWSYHHYPQNALLFTGFSYLICSFLSPYLVRIFSSPSLLQKAMVASSCVALLVLAAVLVPLRHFFHEPDEVVDYPELRSYLAQIEPSTTIYILSTNVQGVSEAYKHNLKWGSRFAHLWMLPAIVQNETGPSAPPAPFKRLSPMRVAELSTILRTDVAEDLDYWKPTIVLVEHCSSKEKKMICTGLIGRDFNAVPWFLQDSRFAEAWSHYQLQEGTAKGFDLYKRTR